MPIRSFYETGYGLRRNPFSGRATYGEDKQQVYVPELFGPQREEFLRKFILAPLENGEPLMGAVWSLVPGDPEARGFGKSTLMGEEAKRVNRDFGYATLRGLEVSDEDARLNPILTGYVSFNAKAEGGIASIDAAGFNLVRFLLRSDPALHGRLRERALARLVELGEADPDDGGEAIVAAVRRKFRQIAVTIDIRNVLEEYLIHLASPDSDELSRFLAEGVTGWHHGRNGLKYLQIFVVFAELAGVEHFTFFIDQVEDFTSSAGVAKIQRQVKIIRDALFESEPFASRASFVFQLHPVAWERLSVAWAHEDLRPLVPGNPLNAPVVVVLEGLTSFDAGRLLVERFLNHPEFALPGRRAGIEPFTEPVLRAVWEVTRPVPRNFLRVLHDLLKLGKDARRPVLDEDFARPQLADVAARAGRGEDEQVVDDERLA